MIAEAHTETLRRDAAVRLILKLWATTLWPELAIMNVGNPHPPSQKPSRTLISIQRVCLCPRRAPTVTPDSMLPSTA